MTNFSFGRREGRSERGNNNIPEPSLESAGIIKQAMQNFRNFFIVCYYDRYQRTLNIFFKFVYLVPNLTQFEILF